MTGAVPPLQTLERQPGICETDLLGRDEEIALVERMLAAIREGGNALVIHGDPGIGKSALLRRAVQYADEHDIRTLSATAVRSEAELPFAGLHQMLRPIMGAVKALPTAQRDAVLTAFGVIDGPPPELFRVASGVLDLLSESAAEAPILVIAEDAHWLDHATSEVLAFVARRLQADPIVMLVASRIAGPLIDVGLSELRLTGLDAMSAANLVDVHGPDLAPPVRERVLKEAAGNPLALVELPAALAQTDLTLPLAPVPLTERLEHAFAFRASELPRDTRTLLLAAALNDSDSLDEALSAAAHVEGTAVETDAITPAVSARLVQVEGLRLQFRHPLVRSAIRQTASLSERHALHGALAAVLVHDPDRAIWHRAAASLGPDDALADELEASARRAEQRGALITAAAGLERAARSTTASADRTRRLLRAAELAVQLGQRALVVRLIGEVEAADLCPVDMGRKMWILETLDPGITGDPAVVLPLVGAAEQARQQGEADLALRLLWAAASNSYWANRSEETHDEIVAVTKRLPVGPDDARVLSILAYSGNAAELAEVMSRLAAMSLDPSLDSATLQLLGNAAFTVSAPAIATRFLTASVDALRDQGRLVPLAQSLVMRAWSEIHLGHWDIAAGDAQEASLLAHETAQPIWEAGAQVAQAWLAAVRGDEETAVALCDAADAVVLPAGGHAVIAVVQLTRGMTALAAGRHAEALENLMRMLDPTDPAHHRLNCYWALPYIAEAAAREARHGEAEAVLRQWATKALAKPSPILRYGLAYGRAVLAGDEETERLIATALSAETGLPPFERARLQLALGTWLRRHRRVADARAPLRASRDCFDALGATLWSERARQELRASGEKSRKRLPDLRDQLSPQELQIANMAADGFSNREIGQKLFLSHRTVGSHLYRLFPKLGITSRTELAAALGQPSAAA